MWASGKNAEGTKAWMNYEGSKHVDNTRVGASSIQIRSTVGLLEPQGLNDAITSGCYKARRHEAREGEGSATMKAPTVGYLDLQSMHNKAQKLPKRAQRALNLPTWAVFKVLIHDPTYFWWSG